MILLQLKAAGDLYPVGIRFGNRWKKRSTKQAFSLTGDSFTKIIVRHDIRKRWYDDSGVLNIGMIDFLLDNMVA